MVPATDSTTEGETNAEQAADDSRTAERVDAEPEWPDLSFTLYIRPGASTVTKDRQSQIQDRFEQLEDIAVIDDLTVEQWSKEVDVPSEGSATDQAAVDLFDEFKEAVEPIDARLTPFFEERPQVSSFLSRSTTDRIIVFPVLGVTVRRDDDLVGLYPCWRDGFHYSVGDCLDMLEDGDSVANLV